METSIGLFQGNFLHLVALVLYLQQWKQVLPFFSIFFTFFQGQKIFTPEDYIPLFQKMGITTIVRLNKKEYDRNSFIQEGSYILGTFHLLFQEWNTLICILWMERLLVNRYFGDF